MGSMATARSLLARQAPVALVVTGLGVYAILSAHGVEGLAVTATDTRSIVEALSGLELTLAFATASALIAAALVAVPFGQRFAERPLEALAEEVEALATGSGTTLSASERKDTVGRLARATLRLKDGAERKAAAALEAAKAAEPPRGDVAGTQMRLDRFAVQLDGEVRRLATLTKRLAEAAETAAGAARRASEGSEQIAAASSNTAGDVSSVATASEQLLDSIEEISRQVVQSTAVVRKAVERVGETNSGMDRLSSAAQKVGDVVSLISRIAAQTNLLALNATIEAARAGEAGRGFAVVAQEVKTLATQTAKATQDVTWQITEIQQATSLSVDAIDKIQLKISEVEHISTIIAAAVHEQGAATQEIARNVRSAAAGTAAMSGHIDTVARSVGDSTTTAGSVSELARELEEIANGMANLVGDLSAVVKAA